MPQPPREPRWSEPQRAAIVREIIAGGVSARVACERAAAGELEHSTELEPFAMPVATAQHYAGQERRRLELETIARDPTGPAARVYRQTAADLERASRRESRRRGGPRPSELAAIARAARELETLRRSLERTGTQPAPAPSSSPQGDASATSSSADPAAAFAAELAAAGLA